MNAQTSHHLFRTDALEIDGEQVHLIGSGCDSCGAHAFPPRRVCASSMMSS